MLSADGLTLRLARPTATLVGAGAVGIVAGVVGSRAHERLGTSFVIGAIGMIAAWWLVSRPLACVVAIVATTILLESDPKGAIPITVRWYRSFLGGALTTTDLLIAIAVVAVIVDHYRRPQPFRTPGRYLLPLALILAGTVAGMVTGWAAGADTIRLLNSARVLVSLVVLPFLVVHVLQHADLVRRSALVIAGLATAKGIAGLVAVALGQGRRVGVEAGDAGAVLTYYAPTVNFLTMLVPLGVLSLAVTRRPLPRWAYPSAAICLLSLVFSYRRSFWIAIVIAAVLIGVVASGRRGRLVMVATVALVGFGISYTLRSGGATEKEGAVAERVRSLNPDEIEATPEDRYRLDEQRNVFEEIRRQPLTGLGFGVPWEARHPLPEEHPGGRDYTHTTVLWYWLKTGPLGLLGYLTLHGVTILTGYRVWRRSRDAVIGAAGLAIGAGVIGLAVAETTGSFTGVDPRFTVIVAAVCAWLAAADSYADPARASSYTTRVSSTIASTE